MADSWFPRPPEAEMRRITAETFYETEMEARRHVRSSPIPAY